MSRVARAVRLVGLVSVRLASLASLFFGLVLARGGDPVLGTGSPALAALAYVALERRRPDGVVWLLYVAGFLVFAWLRQLADDLGVVVQLGYVIALDSSLPGADIPTVWLQRLGFDPSRVAHVGRCGGRRLHVLFRGAPRGCVRALAPGIRAVPEVLHRVLSAVYAGLLARVSCRRRRRGSRRRTACCRGSGA